MKKTPFRSCLAALLAGASLALAPWTAAAQPATGDKPIRMVVPLAAGSTVDAVARAIGPSFGKATGHPVVVENIVGSRSPRRSPARSTTVRPAMAARCTWPASCWRAKPASR